MNMDSLNGLLLVVLAMSSTTEHVQGRVVPGGEQGNTIISSGRNITPEENYKVRNNLKMQSILLLRAEVDLRYGEHLCTRAVFRRR